MNRRTFIAAASVFALHPTLRSQISADADLHALYTAILTDSLLFSCLGSPGYCDTPEGPCYCDDPKKERLLIGSVTFPLTQADRVRLTALPLHHETYPPGPTPPWQRPRTYNTRVPTELQEAFDSTRQESISLRGPFELPAPYRMATVEDAKGFFESHSMIQFGIALPSTPEQAAAIKRHNENEREYGSFTACVQLSTALFNRNRTMALATLRWDSGGDSQAPDTVYIFEKFEGQWRRYATPIAIIVQQP